METTYGGKDLQRYAGDIGVEHKSLRSYKTVAQAWEKSRRLENVSWSVHQALASQPDRYELIHNVRTLKEARQAIKAERDENTCREEMKPSEKISLGEALREQLTAEAKERQGRPGQARSENFTEQAKPAVRDQLGQLVDMSGVSYERARGEKAGRCNPTGPPRSGRTVSLMPLRRYGARLAARQDYRTVCSGDGTHLNVCGGDAARDEQIPHRAPDALGKNM